MLRYIIPVVGQAWPQHVGANTPHRKGIRVGWVITNVFCFGYIVREPSLKGVGNNNTIRLGHSL